MTRRMMHDLGCACGRHFRRPLYHIVDGAQHPGLRYAILGGVLNVVQCPGCERVARVTLPVLYRDAPHGHLVYVYGEEAEEQAGALRSELIKIVQDLRRTSLLTEPVQPTLMFGIERLATLIEAQLGEDEQLGSIAFDVRPGKNPERIARLGAERIAAQTGSYVHAWREGGRLHLQILGPRARLQSATAAAQ